MEKEITVYYIARNYPECKVVVSIGTGVTCAHVTEELLDQLDLAESASSQKGAWHLVERWKGCERRLPSSTPMQEVCGGWGCEGGDGVRVCLKRGQKDQQQLQQRKRKKGQRRRLKSSLLSNPKSFLTKITSKRLQLLRRMMSKLLRQATKQQRAIMLSRLRGGAPLWGPEKPTILDTMRSKLATLKEHNFTFATGISNLNIQSTRLRHQLLPLRKRATVLSEQLLALQTSVGQQRGEREREVAREGTETKTELLRVRRELELKNRLNSLQTAKLQGQKDKLASAKTLLAQKQQELKQLVARQQVSHVTSHDGHMTLPNTPMKVKDGNEDHASGLPQTPPSPSKTTPSTNKKRHFSVFEMKHKQFVEEEGVVFRQSHDPQKGSHDQAADFEFQSSGLDSYKRSANDIHTEGPDVLLIPKPDQNWYETGTQDSPKIPYQDRIMERVPDSEGGIGIMGPGPEGKLRSHDPKRKELKGVLRRGRLRKEVGVVKKVHFTPESLILTAALEGDFELVKKCVQELGSCSSTSDKGATCLHNAVCSGDPRIVHYLVELGCDINTQDVDGWTPLHCAVAYSNHEMVQYLLEHGASLFLTTKDGETPLMIGEEECKLQGDDGLGGGVNQLTADCLQLIKDAQSSLGRATRVSTLFSRHKSSDPQELAFKEGESLSILSRPSQSKYWWLAENARKEQGLVPYTHLGLHCRYKAAL